MEEFIKLISLIDDDIINLQKNNHPNAELLLRIRGILDQNGLVKGFESSEDRNFFLSYIQSKLSFKEQFVIIGEITKFSILSKELRKKELISSQAIKREMRKKAQEQKPKEEMAVTFDTIDKSGFTEEELALFEYVARLYQEKLNEYVSPESVLSQEDGYEDRETIYTFDNKYCWNYILADIEDNLLKQIATSKEKVFQIFSLIRKYDQESKENNQKWQNRLQKINEMIETISEIKFSSLVKDYNGSYDYIINEREHVDLKNLAVSMEYIELGYYEKNVLNEFLKKLNFYAEELSTAISDNFVTCDVFNQISFDELQREYNDIIANYDKREMAYKEKLQSGYQTTTAEEEVPFSQNLVFVLGNEVSFDGVKKLNDEKERVISFINAKEITIFVPINQMHQLSSLNKKEGKNAPTNRFGRVGNEISNKYFTAMRFRTKGKYRVGVIQFEVNQHIKEKLQKRYNLANTCAILGLFGVVEVNANHDEYDTILIRWLLNGGEKNTKKNSVDIDLNDLRNYNPVIQRIAILLNDPESDFEQLCSLIDSGLITFNDIQKRVNNPSSSKGGK